MSEDKELQVRLQFLEEAQEYLDQMESGLLGLGAGKTSSQQMDGVLRAAHSIKGGAAMMRFPHLSHLAHRLEDFFKVLKVGKPEAVDGQLESWLLAGVDFLRQIIVFNRQQTPVNEEWIANHINPTFELIYERLGDPQPEDAAALLSAEVGEDMNTLIFETEVEELLSGLETSLAEPEAHNLAAELLNAAQELGGLAEMLELSAFFSLCQSTIHHLEQNPAQSLEIAQAAVKEWRRSQALVLIGQVDVLADKLELDDVELAVDIAADHLDSSDLFDDSLPDTVALSDLLEVEELETSSLELFSSLENIVPTSESTDIDTSDIEPLPDSVAQFTPATSLEQPESAAVKEQTIRVGVKQLEQLSNLFGEIAIEKNGLSLRLKSLHNLVNLLSQRVKTLEQSNFKLRIAYDKVATETVAAKLTSKVNTKTLDSNHNAVVTTPAIAIDTQTVVSNTQEYFDSLEMDSYSDIHLLSQELMETVVQIQEVAKDIEISLDDTDKNTKQLDRTTKQMQNTISRVRMRPISDLLNRFPRALRDLEMQYGKKVRLQVRGGSTPIDRSILEALNDPLLHLFRNAFDHGIESPPQRLAANKPEEGVITISAAHRGNQTVITIADDGAGIDLEKIKAKAISLGIDAEDLADATPEEILDLIFEPGFSTADQVTDLSGRGVGMDVVRTNIEEVNGTIQVDTKLGSGTKFTISVPFSISVVRVLLVESNGMLLAFPTNVIEEMLILNPQMIDKSSGREVLNWDGFSVPLIRLAQWLNLSDYAYNVANELEASPTIEEPTVLMIAQNNDLIGLQIDRYWQEEEVTTRSIEGNIALPPGFSGCTILGDGRVVPLVDVSSLLNWIAKGKQDNHDRHRPLEREKQALSNVSGAKKTIMVIDDSINVRRFMALTLEKANYRVEQAKDGQDALDKLKSGAMPQAIICDIEMPRLDGFGFLSRVKAEPLHKNIPVIMLTSRSGDKHKKLALNLGAREYFSKPLKDRELLATLETLTK